MRPSMLIRPLILMLVLLSFTSHSPSRAQPLFRNTTTYLPAVSKNLQPANLRIRSSRGLYIGPRTYYLVGEVENVGEQPAYNVQVTAQLYFDTGELGPHLGVEAFLKKVDPGQRAPFYMNLTQPEGLTGISRYTLSVDFQTQSDVSYFPITITSIQIRSNDSLDALVNLRNDQSISLRDIRFAVTFYDQDGNVVYAHNQPLFINLKSGETAFFSIFYEKLVYSSYVVQVEGRE